MSEQGADDTPHLTYYDTETGNAYIWNGNEDYIGVCEGGYGEPVARTIHAPAEVGGAPLSVTEWLELFAGACQDDAERVATGEI